VFIPVLQQEKQIALNQSTNFAEFVRREPVIPAKGNRVEPEFTDAPFTLNVYMFGLITVKAEEEEPIGAGDISDGWHLGHP
jgi:hypothetical protein